MLFSILPLLLAFQTAGAVSAPTVHSVADVGFGVTSEGDPVLLGPGYRMVLEPERVRFHPALGTAAPTAQELAFELIDVRVGESVLTRRGDPVRLIQAGATARYEYRDVVVHYDATDAGIEQSFELLRRPAAAGELVVRLRISTNMRRSADEQLAFELPGVGGVTIGAVTGIDANGATIAGASALDGAILEYSLPASFLAEAAYPLVLDPLVAPVVEASNPFTTQPAARTDAVSDGANYLVVWDVAYAADDFDVHGRALDHFGVPQGLVRSLRVTIGSVSQAPSVGYVRHPFGYVAAWQEGPAVAGPFDILACTVRTIATPFSISVSPEIAVATTSADERSPSVAGDTRNQLSGAIVVWVDEALGVRARQARPNTTTGADLGLSATVIPGLDHRDATITKNGSDIGRYLVATERFYASPAPGDHDIRCVAIDRSLNTVGPISSLGTISVDDQSPSVTGDGTTYTVAWDVETASGPFVFDHDIHAAQLRFDGTVLAERAIAAVVGTDDFAPRVSRTGDRTAIVWSSGVGVFGTYGIELTTLCNDTFATCDLGHTASLDGVNFYPAVASTKLGSDDVAGERGIVAWAHSPGTLFSDAEIETRLFESYEPWTIDNLGGGCGAPLGLGIQGPPAVGHQGFRWFIDPLSSVPSVLVMNAKPNAGPPVMCGSCALQLDFGITQVISPLVGGFSDVFSTPIPGDPSLQGLVITTQFFALPATTAPCAGLGPFAASDRYRFTIGF